MISRIQIEMVNGLVIDENMSYLTSTSSEISASSGACNNNASLSYPQHSSASTIQEPQPKKKKSLPGHPDPEAEVIALSPKALLATNRFICDVCNKGFQRDQNLQLHRRGHNLPWKLKKSNSSKEITRKKVYVCPEPTCVHHDPSRALGDITGIKKHFCRKHGEKKWKCDKCSKRYAVQSDWKAHSKICATRQYKCDCGTIFFRRDSFITHRAFCDALAQESTEAITAVNPLTMSSHDIQLHSHGIQAQTLKKEQEINVRPEIPLCLEEAGHGRASGFSSPPLPLSTHLDHSSVHHENPNPTTTLLPSFQSIASSSHHMSATALLQKASQIGVTMRKTSPSLIGTGFAHGLASSNENKAAGIATTDYLEEGTELAPHCLFHDMMGSTSTVHLASPFEESLTAMMNPTRDNHNFQELVSKSGESQFGKNHNANDETRDFIGLTAFDHRDWA